METLKVSQKAIKHFSARLFVTIFSFAGVMTNSVTGSSNATPMLPKCRPNAPLKSKKPICKRAGAITETEENEVMCNQLKIKNDAKIADSGIIESALLTRP